MICIGGVKSMLGGPEVLVGMSKDSIIHIRLLFFDVRLPLEEMNPARYQLDKNVCPKEPS